jgi:hypothetical protein
MERDDMGEVEMAEEKDLIETFRKLRPDVRHIMLAQARSSLTAEETRKQHGLLSGRGPAQTAEVENHERLPGLGLRLT